ncbi:MAG TPA: hypothetical protein VFZ23_10595 [Pyrinomonadaceae bacterium]
MSRFDSPLDDLRVASPCSADWNQMQGDERKRFCGDCKLYVYNLSGMTRYDAENLLRLSEGHLCVRYFQRADGSILTQDCPVGWAIVKQRVKVFAAAVLSLILSLFGGIFIVGAFDRRSQVVGRFETPRSTPTPRPIAVMGNIAMPTPTPAPEFHGGAVGTL